MRRLGEVTYVPLRHGLTELGWHQRCRVILEGGSLKGPGPLLMTPLRLSGAGSSHSLFGAAGGVPRPHEHTRPHRPLDGVCVIPERDGPALLRLEASEGEWLSVLTASQNPSPH